MSVGSIASGEVAELAAQSATSSAGAGSLELDVFAGATALVRRLDVGLLSVSGGDRWSWLNGMVTCNVAKPAPGGAHYGLFAQKNGKIQADCWIAPSGEEAWIALPRTKTSAIATSLDHYLIMEDAELRAEEDGWDVYVVLGEAARRVVDAAKPHVRALGWTHRCGHEVGVLFAATGERAAIEAQVASIAGARLVDDAGWTTARIALGWPELGVDFDEGSYPQEAALERDAVAFDKGCYLGQEAVFMLEKRGRPSRRLVQLCAVDSGSEGQGVRPESLVGAAIVADDGTALGTATSAALVSGQLVALGVVKFRYARAGTTLSVGGARFVVTARLAPASVD